MTHGSLSKLVPLLSSRLLISSTTPGTRCRTFSALARAFANPYVPCKARHSPWSLTPLDELTFSYPSATFTKTSIARYMRQMDDEVSSMLQLFNMGLQRPAQFTAPAVNTSPMGMTVEVKEDNKNLTFLAALPGFSRDDIKVKLTKDKVLVITGQHTASTEDEGAGHSQRISRTFTRRYQLPDDTNTESISAKLQDGLLTLTVPKANAPEIEDQEIMIQDAGAISGGAGKSEPAASMDASSNAQAAEAISEDKMGAAAPVENPMNAEAPEPKNESHTAPDPVKNNTVGASSDSGAAARENPISA